MIKSLRRKFIAIAMCSLIGVLVLIIGFINTFSYIDVVNKVDSRLSLIEGNNGTFFEKRSTAQGWRYERRRICSFS